MSKEYFSNYEHVQVYGDGDKLCATFHDFVDLMESPAGFGNTDAEAIAELAHCVRQDLQKQLASAEDQISELEDSHAEALHEARHQHEIAMSRVHLLEDDLATANARRRDEEHRVSELEAELRRVRYGR